ncbi:MAG: DUF4468 domain-containing protein [Bacteroidaceae bacterium]|nr:DUF4468 domain-containing protein [Bacteroidaceae bacterium]
MKKLLLCMMLIAAIGATAKEKKDDSKYLKGAVPEVNGMVTFSKSFSVPGKTEAELRDVMNDFVNKLVENSIPAPGNYARMMEEEGSNDITARVCEWLVFTKKVFNLDRARFRYQIKVSVTGQHITMTVDHISYYYNEDMETNNGEIFKAEEWISDKEALNKKQTKLYPISGKFRRKTVDRMEELFDTAMDTFEVEEPKKVEPVKPKRKTVVEE